MAVLRVSRQREAHTKPNWTILDHEVERGCVLWLGPLEATHGPVVLLKGGSAANPGIYNHPIMVLSRPASSPSKIQFCVMTSLHGKTLEEKCGNTKGSKFHRGSYLPIVPAPEHPNYRDGNNLYRSLTLENGDVLEKSSYINVRDLYEMEWAHAELYWGADPTTRKKWKLDQASLRSLTKLVTKTAGLKHVKQYDATGSIPDGLRLPQEQQHKIVLPPLRTSEPSLVLNNEPGGICEPIEAVQTWTVAAPASTSYSVVEDRRLVQSTSPVAEQQQDKIPAKGICAVFRSMLGFVLSWGSPYGLWRRWARSRRTDSASDSSHVFV